jgi:hypothetical protein
MILDMIARLPGLTEVDGSISPLEELDDSTWTRKDGTGPVCVLISVDSYNGRTPFIFIGLLDLGPGVQLTHRRAKPITI